MNTTQIQRESNVNAAIKKIKRTISDLNTSEQATLELLLEKEAQIAIKKSHSEFKRGDFLTLEEFKR